MSTLRNITKVKPQHIYAKLKPREREEIAAVIVQFNLSCFLQIIALGKFWNGTILLGNKVCTTNFARLNNSS